MKSNQIKQCVLGALGVTVLLFGTAGSCEDNKTEDKGPAASGSAAHQGQDENSEDPLGGGNPAGSTGKKGDKPGSLGGGSPGKKGDKPDPLGGGSPGKKGDKPDPLGGGSPGKKGDKPDPLGGGTPGGSGSEQPAKPSEGTLGGGGNE